MLTEYDPESHIVVVFPAVEALRRETGFQSLVAFMHQEVGAWVLAFRSDDGRYFKEIGPLDGQAGASHEMDSPTFQRYTRLLKSAWGDASSVKARFQAEAKQVWETQAEAVATQRGGIEAMARTVARDHGPKKADEYLRNAGVFQGVKVFSGGGS